MFYSVRIARIGSEGTPLGNPLVQTAPSEGEALQIMRRAVDLARTLTYPMQFSVFGPSERLLLNYTSGATGERIASGAAP